jgi:hypothetical protein
MPTRNLVLDASKVANANEDQLTGEAIERRLPPHCAHVIQPLVGGRSR